MLSIFKLSDVNGQPVIKLDAPQLKIGDPVALRLRLERRTNGRHEVLNINGRFIVTASGFDGSTPVWRQLISLDCVGSPPTWTSVKKTSQVRQPWAPTKNAPKRVIE